MRIYICPVSGGAFPVQLSHINELSQKGIKPDLVLGSSGGNIAAYVGLASFWEKDKMHDIIGLLSSSMFASSWWPSYLSFLPSWFIGYFKGSVYADGTGASDIFTQFFTSDSIKATEIWTGTMNCDTTKGQLFCNRSREEARIQPEEPKWSSPSMSSFWTRDCMPLTYLNGDVSFISQVTMASASIPVLVPEKMIQGNRYVDGGTLFSSPLTALQEQILSLLETETIIHFDYLSSFDLQATHKISPQSLYDTGTSTFGELVKSLCVQDRSIALEALRSNQKKNPHLKLYLVTLDGCPDALRAIEELRSCYSPTVLEMCPLINTQLDILKFGPTEITHLMNQTSQNYKLRFWWLGPPDEDELPDKLENLFPPRP